MSTDANWAHSSHAITGVNTSAGLQWEEAFAQDFNGDSLIGMDPLA